MKGEEYPVANQGTTSGEPGEIECPTCGCANDVSGDPIDEGDEHTCAHCDAKFTVTGVDYIVSITVRAKASSG